MTSTIFHFAPAGLDANTGTNPDACSDLALGAARQDLLIQALLQVQRGADGTADLRVELPSVGEVRMRNLVHRGAPRPVFKTTSVKLERVVQCESALEHEAVLLLDVTPTVQAFGEQPVRLRYLLGNEWRYHIPDFAVLMDGRLTFIEIKFAKDVDEEVSVRTRWMEGQLAGVGAGYRLLTEHQLRQGDLVQNARCVLRRARHTVSNAQLLATLETLRSAGRVPLTTFGWSVADSLHAIGIAKLIMSGHAAIEPLAPLSDRSCVWLSEAGHRSRRAA